MKSPSPTALIISIGDELIYNRTVNSNGSELSAGLSNQGVNVRKLIALGDIGEDIIREVRECREDILILTGGLGPTEDDRTVSCVAEACKVAAVIDPKHLVYLEGLRKKRNLPERFLRQATVPEGFTVIRSQFGTAPFLYHPGKPFIFLLPGVPYECLSLFNQKVIPLIRKAFPSLSRQGSKQEIKILSVSESMAEEALTKVRKSNDGMTAAFLPSLGELLIRLKGDSPAYLKKTAERLREVFPDHHSYMSPLNRPVPSAAERIHHFLTLEKWRVGFAESCTGGLLTAQFVCFPGSSLYLDCGAVTYSNSAKSDFAGVSPDLIKKFGAVSPEVAEAMAAGLAKKRKLHLAVSITGIAGPGGGSSKKPVGLVYIGVYHSPPITKSRDKSKIRSTAKPPRPILVSRKFQFGVRGFAEEGRNRIRDRAVKNALFMMMEVCFPKSTD